jgi:hypothetical protein
MSEETWQGHTVMPGEEEEQVGSKKAQFERILVQRISRVRCEAKAPEQIVKNRKSH